MAKAHVIVLGNEKGGTGKSTTAVHIAVALMHSGRKVAAIDLDSRQRTFTRYMENRQSFSEGHGLGLKTPRLQVIDDSDSHSETLLRTTLDAWAPVVDVIVVDTPGRDSPLSRVALGRADTLITPMNDSFIDFDVLGRIDPVTYEILDVSQYASSVRDARRERRQADNAILDWVVVRNRMASITSRNEQRVASCLRNLSMKLGFRIADGISERVIFREFFPVGLTALDDLDERVLGGRPTLSHLSARQEIRQLVAALRLPADEMGRKRAEARQRYAETIGRPIAMPDIFVT